MESEITDTLQAQDARLQTLYAELGCARRRSAMVMEQVDTLHQEHEALLTEALQIMADDIAVTSELDHARTLLAHTRALVRDEQELLQGWQRLVQAERALWREHHALLASVRRASRQHSHID
jgi:hypothetical protein